MNLYGHDHSFIGLSFSDLFAETIARNSPDLKLESPPSTSAADPTANDVRSSGPPRHRHDDSSPLPWGWIGALLPANWMDMAVFGLMIPALDGIIVSLFLLIQSYRVQEG